MRQRPKSGKIAQFRVLRYDFYADCGEVFDVWRVFKKTNPPTSPFTKGSGVPIRKMGRGILVAAEGRLRIKINEKQKKLKNKEKDRRISENNKRH